MSQMRLLQSFGLQYVVASAPDGTLQFVKKKCRSGNMRPNITFYTSARTLFQCRVLERRTITSRRINEEILKLGDVNKVFKQSVLN